MSESKKISSVAPAVASVGAAKPVAAASVDSPKVDYVTSAKPFDLDELILGKDVLIERQRAFPNGVASRPVRKLSDADKVAIRATRFARVSEIAKHFGVSPTTVHNIRKKVK